MPFDEKSLIELSFLYPDIKTRAIHLFNDIEKVLNLKTRITEGIRSMSRQEKLYSCGRVKIDGVWRVDNPRAVLTNARPGESMHHYGLAFDICFQGRDPYLAEYPKNIFDHTWRKVGEIGQRNGFKWGFDWNGNGLVDGNDFDRPHFEMSYGERAHDLREMFSLSGIAGVWARCDQRRGIEIKTEWNDLTIKEVNLKLL